MLNKVAVITLQSPEQVDVIDEISWPSGVQQKEILHWLAELLQGSIVRNNLMTILQNQSKNYEYYILIIIRKSILLINRLFIVYVDTGMADGASTRIQISVNGEIVGLRKWKVP